MNEMQQLLDALELMRERIEKRHADIAKLEAGVKKAVRRLTSTVLHLADRIEFPVLMPPIRNP